MTELLLRIVITLSAALLAAAIITLAVTTGPAAAWASFAAVLGSAATGLTALHTLDEHRR